MKPICHAAMQIALAMLLVSAKTDAQKTAVPMKSIPDSIPTAVSHATKIRPFDKKTPLDVLVCFAFPDPKAVQAFADAVSDPNNPLYGKFLTPAQIGERFGPAPEDIAAMKTYLESKGLKITEVPVTKMTLSAHGTAAQMEAAFGVELNEYRESAADGKRRGNATPQTFFASAKPIALPENLVGKVTSVEGLESWTRAMPRIKKLRKTSSGPFDAGPLRTAYNLAPLYNSGLRGEGRTIAISNYDGFSLSNARKYITRNGLPMPAAGGASNVTIIRVGGGGGSGSLGVGEGDLDIQMVLGFTPLASILVYDNGKPLNNNVPQNVLAVFNREINDNLADVITESYAWPATDTALITSWHNAHLQMTLLGMTYTVASGDNGEIRNYGYPYSDIEPEILSIGGTVVTLNSDNTIASETAWSGGGGGYNAAAFDFNVLPSWQKGPGVPTDVNLRLVPDISLHSSGPDAATGAVNIYYLGFLVPTSGTSCASPMVAAGIGLIEQYLIGQNAIAPVNGKYRLGRLNNRIYSLGGNPAVFHDITTGSNGFPAATGWDYATGWGTPDFYGLAQALAVPPTATLSGTVTLDGIANPAATPVPVGAITFTLRPTSGNNSPITMTQTLGAGGTFTLASVPPAPYQLAIKGAKWLQVVTNVDATAGNVSGISAVLPGGDANNDNTVDISDFGILINAYSTVYDANNAANGYDPRADLNCDGLVDISDFGLLANSYGTTGAP